MKRFFYVLIISIVLICQLDHVLEAQTINRIKAPDLEKMLGNQDNTLFVINFWASWCGPCVKELPHFQKVSEEFKAEKVKFIYISLDFPSQVESHLKPFLKNNKITSSVSVMMDTDYDKWISSVDSSWQGNIPATLFLSNPRNIRQFHSGELNENELRSIINSFL